jgi:hypothetical protein
LEQKSNKKTKEEEKNLQKITNKKACSLVGGQYIYSM